MGLIKLRTVPEELHRRLKACAAVAGLTLETYCIAQLEAGNADNRGSGTEPARSFERSGNHASVPVVRSAKGSKKRLHPMQPVREELASGGNGPAQLSEPQPGSGKIGSCPHDAKRTEAFCRLIGGGC